jgi:adenylate cyclase
VRNAMSAGQKIKKIFKLSGFKIGISLTILSVVIYAVGAPFLHVMEQKAYDLHFRSRGAIKPGNEVVIVGIDEKSVNLLGRWPWPRTRIARLIDRLGEYGAKVIAFDIVFSEPERSEGSALLKELKTQVRDRKAKAALERASRKADSDSRLAASLRKNPAAVLGYFFFTTPGEIKQRKDQDLSAGGVNIPSRMSVRYLDRNAAAPDIPRALGVEQNIPLLAKAASHFGYFNIIPDSDGTVRWAPLAFRYGDDIYPHISLEAVRLYRGSPPLLINEAEYGVDSIQLGRQLIPTDEGGRLLINFRGPQKTFPHYSFVDVLNGAVPASAFKDKIVLVGATAIGIYDMRVTPFSGVFPGVEINANIIDNILRNDAISRPDWTALYDLAAILFLGILLSLVISRVRPLAATLITIALLAAYAVANEFIFTHFKLWLTAIYPGMTMVFVFVGVITYRIMTEEKKKKEIKNAFSRYVSPSLVDDILKDPSKLVLGGEERRLTVFFSDIRGFTTISEGLSPQNLVKLINDYLTPMTDIILESGGTVDKYMGDAIMAFWGAPVWQDDHAIRAARTALLMMERLRKLQVEWEKNGLPRIDIGIGLSTGRLTCGNMGSHLRFDYTVMGDSVNLGSRLEGLNKEYGTHIIVPKFTYEDIKDEFILRQLDHIKVKGKKIPIKIYELMADKSGGDKLREAAGLFETGLAAYRERDWDKAESFFGKTLEVLPEDKPSKVFLARVRDLRSSNLPDDWDGVYVMTKK